VPLGALPFPSPFTSQNGDLTFYVSPLGNNPSLAVGTNAHNRQRQLDFVDSVSLQQGSHGIKFGIDFRRLSPQLDPPSYTQFAVFADVPSEVAIPPETILYSSLPTTLLFRNLGIFAQDTWRVAPGLTLTYGLRWDTDFAPASLRGPGFAAAVGFDLADLSNLALAPAGTPPYKTTYSNVAPRIGLAYQVSQNPQWQMVIRGGFGVFYDLATSEAGNIASSISYPFGSFGFAGLDFPPIGNAANPPPITPPSATNFGAFYAFDPKLRLPFTLQWNVAIEQSLGKQQSLTASYVGAAGRRLLQTAEISEPNPNLSDAILVTNASTSDYDAVQLQFHRQMSHGLQALASYTWSHSIDTGSAGSIGNGSNELSVLNSNINRGPSDFDVRNAFSMGLAYDVHVHSNNVLVHAVLLGWSVESVVQARSAAPVDVNYLGTTLSNGFQTNARPNVVAGQPFYLDGPIYPGGKAFNAAAFTFPALDPITGLPLGQGDLPRNALRGFGAAQWDFAVHREIPIHESVKLQFRAEMFNLLNHPNFGPPSGTLANYGVPNSQFGLSSAMLGQSLAGGNLGAGAFDPLYQLGGPRSMQFALKLFF